MAREEAKTIVNRVSQINLHLVKYMEATTTLSAYQIMHARTAYKQTVEAALKYFRAVSEPAQAVYTRSVPEDASTSYCFISERSSLGAGNLGFCDSSGSNFPRRNDMHDTIPSAIERQWEVVERVDR